MKRTVQMQRAGTPSAKTGQKRRKVKAGAYSDAIHVVRSLHSVGGRRPGANAKRRKHMAASLGFGSWDAYVAAMKKIGRRVYQP